MKTSTIAEIMEQPIKRYNHDSTKRCPVCYCPMWEKGEWYLCPVGCSDGQWVHKSDLRAYYK